MDRYVRLFQYQRLQDPVASQPESSHDTRNSPTQGGNRQVDVHGKGGTDCESGGQIVKRSIKYHQTHPENEKECTAALSRCTRN
jgi:hypothetical protein